MPIHGESHQRNIFVKMERRGHLETFLHEEMEKLTNGTFFHEEMERQSLKIEGAWKNARLSNLTLSFSPQGYFKHKGAHWKKKKGFKAYALPISPKCD